MHFVGRVCRSSGQNVIYLIKLASVQKECEDNCDPKDNISVKLRMFLPTQ